MFSLLGWTSRIVLYKPFDVDTTLHSLLLVRGAYHHLAGSIHRVESCARSRNSLASVSVA